jgi:hypothetical protein|tara:strand:- start:445 stop:576 length:132 start_codon:yes stop_codon:yes gene_type:complete
MAIISATFPTKKEAIAFGKRAFSNPQIKKRKNGWVVWNEGTKK